MDDADLRKSGHVLVLPLPVQGHINPILQFSKRLVSKGIKVTLFTTILASKSVQPGVSSISVETFSEGEGFESSSGDDFMKKIEIAVCKKLPDFVQKQERLGCPVKCVVCDSIMPWALPLAKELGLIGASFYTQSSAVSAIYYQVNKGLIGMPVDGPTTLVPGLPLLEPDELPSFVYKPDVYPAILPLVLSRFSNVDEADWLLFNTYDKLEEQVVNWMAKQSQTRMITIGPTVPSSYLDKRLEDNAYGLHLFTPDSDTCTKWLDTKEGASVVYMSFGSLANLGEEQMEEIAWGIRNTNYNFIWVVRATEETKLPKNFVQEISGKGLVTGWCQQLEVLAHKAVGCFVTHCGWNSILEALSLGVPMVAVPQWTDQPTNAKFVEDIWKVGVRAKTDEKGMVTRDKLEESIKLVMEGERREEINKNAIRLKELALEAVDEGGSSDKNIDEFVSKILCT
ncbi:hypothetical protein MKW98_030024 [Papaver atlanticum]|uniref:Glycosyltransferase n=1 Tax=Papaver atlanticum TaxID=357466 RepID=A0AAD4T7M7_9MAGN|nr:hypothetical protein MKW98_030024 [Papaver atlanticum]